MITLLSVLPTDTSGLDSCISALKSSIQALESSIKLLEGSSSLWETLLPWFTGLVVIGLVVDVIVVRLEQRDTWEAWSRGIMRPPDRPSTRRHLWELFASVAIFIGVAGELGVGVKIAVINGQLRSKNSELRSKSDQLLALITQEAGDAAQSAKTAHEQLRAISKEADALSEKAGDINAELTMAQWALGARHVVDEADLENGFRKEFKGKLIAFKSYVQDEEAFLLCRQYVSAATKPEVGVIAEDKCADEALPPASSDK